MKKPGITDMFDHEGHFTDEALALCVEAMLNEAMMKDIPEQVEVHLWECEVCNERVVQLHSDLKNEPEICQTIAIQPAPERKLHFTSKFFFSYAAAALVLVMVVAGAYFLMQPPTPEKLFNRYFEPYPNILTVKSEVQNELTKAMLYYEVKDWDSAIVLFQNYLIDESENYQAMFYLGNTYLAKGESEQAVYWLLKGNTFESKFKDQTAWYLALAYLADGDEKNAEYVLQQLSDEKGFYKEKAAAILKKIR